ncbi:MAG: hypothetical protein IIC00_01105 [Planctomycetes bacterium]|nr:hypothetical protein [Planctomycetota bacterium]
MNSKKKWEYFSKRLETMWDVYRECMEHFDAKFSEKWKVFCESRDEQKYKEYLREIEFPYINTLNSAMLIAFCSLTEHVVADITNENVPGYEEKKKRKRGNWLVRNIKLLNERGFDIDQNGEDVRLFSYYIQIRNCVVHNGGKISNSKHSKQLKEAIDAVEKYAKDPNYNMIKIKDDYLMLGSGLISDVVEKSEDIIERILEKI